MTDINASNFPKQVWKVNFLEMLEPRFKSSEVKQIRQKRRTFITKVELLVSIISSISSDPVDLSLTDEDLENKMTKLNKIENDEYLANLKNLTGSSKRSSTLTNQLNKDKIVKIFKEERKQENEAASLKLVDPIQSITISEMEVET